MGNPYHFKESNHSQALYKVDSVEEAISKYGEHLDSELLGGNRPVCDFMKTLVDRELDDKQTNLVCYCAPNKCHGDFIKKYAENVAHVIRWEEAICGDWAKIVGNIWKS
jgi:hypothetical protein